MDDAVPGSVREQLQQEMHRQSPQNLICTSQQLLQQPPKALRQSRQQDNELLLVQPARALTCESSKQ